MKREPWVTIAIMIISASNSLFSAEIENIRPIDSRDPKYTISIIGEIEKGDTKRLLDAFGEFSPLCKKLDELVVNPARGKFDVRVRLKSPGGDVLEALEMANLLRRLHIWRAEVDELCSSACFYLLATAHFKDCYSPENYPWDCRIGVHRPYIPIEYLVNLSAEESDDFHEKVMERVGAFLEDMHVSSELVETMMATSSNSMYWLPRVPSKNVELAGLGVEVWQGFEASPIPGYQEWVVGNCKDRVSPPVDDSISERLAYSDRRVKCMNEIRAESFLTTLCELLDEEKHLN